MGDGRRVVVSTGGAIGIGVALCRRSARARLGGIVDLDVDGAQRTTADFDALGAPAAAVRVDVAREDDVWAMVQETVDRSGPVELGVG